MSYDGHYQTRPSIGRAHLLGAHHLARFGVSGHEVEDLARIEAPLELRDEADTLVPAALGVHKRKQRSIITN